MQRIEVHPDLLDKKAQLVQQKRQELERMVRELEKSIYNLQMEWSGATRENFFADFIRMKEVFPATLKHLEEMQKDLTSTSMLFRTTDESGNSFVRLPELEHNFRKGFLDKFFGEQLIGLGHTTKAFINDPSGTVSDIAYAMTIGKVVDAGRGIKFAWDAAWGNGTARSEVEQIVAEQKKQMDEEGVRYYSGSMTGQVVAYFIFGKALRKADSKHSDLGGSGGGKAERGKGTDSTGDPATKLTNGKGIYGQYSGGLKQSAKEDAGADLLAEKLGGQSRMIFNNDPKGREFDVVSDLYIGQTKTSMNSLSSQFREQAKATIEAAIETNRKAYFHFEIAPADKVIRQLREYEKRYDVEVIIDISPF
ncbi:WXG100 family type VII secretion target [Paenibacillus tundrae]